MYTRPSFIGTYNIRKGFLDRNSLFSTQFSSDFDEPTYLTFKLNFYSDERLTDEMTYDTLPQALFTPPNLPDGNPYDRWMDWATDDELREIIADYQYDPESFIQDRKYSAFNYLLDRNEDFRAFLLAKFLKGWAELQEQYQFYFQSVSGLDRLIESNPSRGSKLSKETTVTIECLEAIDQRVKYLLSLYKAAAWDDEYQRWILPDIYRYFKMDIFISEIRTFHVSNFSDQSSGLNLITNTATNLINKGLGWVNSKLDKWTKGGLDNNIRMDLETLSVINGICPVTCIHCELCDFDISNPYYQGSYDINNSTAENTTIKIKVKKAEIIHNWTLIDRIFGNLLNATERGTKSMTSSVGWRDYLKMDSGPLAQNTFNNTSLLFDNDLKKGYTGTITGGWISRTISNGLNALKGAMSGGSILDFAADIYSTVKNAIADKKANEEKNTISKATSRNKSDIPSMTIKGGYPDDELLDETLVTISNGTVTSDEIVKSAMQLLRQTKTKFKDLSSEQQDAVRKALEKMRLADMTPVSDKQSKNDRSWATDMDGNPNLQKNTELQGMSAVEQNLTPLDTSALNFSMSEVTIGNNKLNFVISGGSITQPEDRSEATDLDGMEKEIEISLSGASPKDANLTPIEGEESSFILTPVSPKPEEDRSWATDLDGLDYPESMTSPIDTSVNLILSDVSIFSTDDRSWATDLDGLEKPSMPNVDMGDDRSWATDLDGLEKPSMPNVDMGDDRSKATDLDGLDEDSLTKVDTEDDKNTDTDTDTDGTSPTQMTIIDMGEDRSLATDLDGLELPSMTGIDTGGDRSLATDLDGQTVVPMTSVIKTEHTVEISDPGIQKEIDRSLATDLDGQTIEGMTSIIDTEVSVSLSDPGIQKEIDRSMATDLDGQSFDTMTSIESDSYQSILTDPGIQKEIDRSIATDLDGQYVPSMTEVVQTESPFETIMTDIVHNNERNESLDFGEITGSEKTQTEINGGNVSPFESLSMSTATSHQSLDSAVHVSQETKLNQSEEMIFLDNGDINPETTVRVILEHYTEFVQKPPKKSTLQNVKIEGNTEKRNNIISPQIVGDEKNKKIKSVL